MSTSQIQAQPLNVISYFGLVKDLLSPDNDTRNSAETILAKISYDDLMMNILKFFESQTVNNEAILDQHKIFSATLLKNKLPIHAESSKNNSDSHDKFEKYLNVIQFISSVPVKSMTTVLKLCDILIQNIDSCLESVSDSVQKSFFQKTIEKLEVINNPVDPLIGMAILANTSGTWSEISLSQSMLMPHVNKFFEQFGQKMLQIDIKENENMLIAANNFLKYSSAFISRSNSTSGLETAVNMLYKVSHHLLRDLKSHTISGLVYDYLQEIAQVRPRLFKLYLEEIIDDVIFIMDAYSVKNNATYDSEKIKVSAMNFLCMLFVDMTKFMMQFHEKLSIFVLHVIDCMAIPDEENDDFNDADDEDNQNFNHISKQSEIVFDKMSVKNPEFMFPFVTQSVTNFLKPNSSVNQMYAGLNILCCAAEGCKTQYQEQLEEIVRQFILHYTYDSQYHPKIRLAALTALGQLISDFGNILIGRLFDEIVDAYSKSILNSSSERVQCHSFAALNNFFEAASAVYIPKAVERLSPAFAAFLQQKFSKRAIMSFFDTIVPISEFEIDLTLLYSAIHNHIMQIIESTCNDKENLPIHCKAVLAIFSLGQFADHSMFQKDAIPLMYSLIKMMRSENVDAMMSNTGYEDYLLSWDIMIRKMSNEFKQFLEFIMSCIYSIIEKNKPMYENLYYDDSIEDINAFNEALRIQSQQSSDASTGLRLISTICQVYKKDVGHYMEKFIEPLTALVDRGDMLIENAYSALAFIILTLNEEKFTENWSKFIEMTLKMDSNQTDPDSFMHIMSSFVTIAETLGPKSITPEFMDNFIKSVILDVLKVQQVSSTTSAKLNYYREHEDFEEYDMLNDAYVHGEEDQDSSFVEGVNIFVRSMFSILGKDFLPYFDVIKDNVDVYLKPENQFTENAINRALNFWIGILEKASEDILLHYFPQISSHLATYIYDKRFILIHSASYAYGLIAEKIKSNSVDNFLSQHFLYLAQMLAKHSKTGASLSGELSYHLAIENVTSALIRILRFKPHLTGNMKMELIALILNFLPFQNDVDELENCYHFTSDLILSGFNDAKHIPQEILTKLVKVQVDAFLIARQILPPELMGKIADSLMNLKSSSPSLLETVKSLGHEYEAVYHNLSKN